MEYPTPSTPSAIKFDTQEGCSYTLEDHHNLCVFPTIPRLFPSSFTHFRFRMMIGISTRPILVDSKARTPQAGTGVPPAKVHK